MPRHSGAISARLWFGIAILSLGILWTLDNLDILESEPILGWWPLLLIAFGVSNLLRKDQPRMLVASFLWIFFGMLLLGKTQDVIPWNLFELWPVILILFGAAIVYRATQGPSAPGMVFFGGSPARDKDAEGVEDEVLSGVAVWAGIDRKSNSPSFRGGDFTAWMGGGEVDLRGAQTVPDGAVLEVFVLMGGLEIRVPEDWRVVNEIFAFMGGTEDSRKSVPPTSKSTLYLKGACIMGGVEIKN